MKINIILLAAGNSTRFNGNKLLASIDGSPMYIHIVNKVVNLDVNKIILVTQYEEIKKALKSYPVEVVINEEVELGISNSIKLGIDFDNSADGYLFMVCDQPFIKEESIKNLIKEFNTSDKGIVSVGHKGNMGNPVIFHRRYIDELRGLVGDVGGKKVLKNHSDDLKIYEVEDEIELIDIDTKEVFKKLV